MTRKTSAYARKRAKQQPLLLNRAYAEAHHTASFLATLRMVRPYSEDDDMPGDVQGAPAVMSVARKAMLQVHSALESLLRCEPSQDACMDFTRVKHAIAVSVIRTLQMIYGTKRRDPYEEIDLGALTPAQAQAVETLHAANQALNRAYDRWEAGKGYGLDGEGRKALIEAIELYDAILCSSTPQQMAVAHAEALKIRAKSGVAA